MKKKTTPRNKPKKAPPVRVVSTLDIEIRAFYIYQERHRQGGEGDPESDWHEAERQLLSTVK